MRGNGQALKRKSRGWAVADPYANMLSDLSVVTGLWPGELIEQLVKEEIKRRLQNEPGFADHLLLAARARQRNSEADLDYREFLEDK